MSRDSERLAVVKASHYYTVCHAAVTFSPHKSKHAHKHTHANQLCLKLCS